MPNMPIPPCACRLERCDDDLHYCCCIVAYPFCCNGRVANIDSAVERHVCEQCANPGDFEEAIELKSFPQLLDAYECCSDHCCDACKTGKKGLDYDPPTARIPRVQLGDPREPPGPITRHYALGTRLPDDPNYRRTDLPRIMYNNPVV